MRYSCERVAPINPVKGSEMFQREQYCVPIAGEKVALQPPRYTEDEPVTHLTFGSVEFMRPGVRYVVRIGQPIILAVANGQMVIAQECGSTAISRIIEKFLTYQTDAEKIILCVQFAAPHQESDLLRAAQSERMFHSWAMNTLTQAVLDAREREGSDRFMVIRKPKRGAIH